MTKWKYTAKEINKNLKERREKKTPVNVQRWADRLQLASVVLGGVALVWSAPWLAAAIAITGGVSKYLSDYSTDD